ncbi:2'-5' RNA ligase family protein [Quadrisphaera sp. KR29]|uniref:2'-5' RNA ligase family protein n=1 Tax=Quadrisphaera sp. KR29 TaxID=3461391 RepID=UPI004044A1EF
MTTTRSADGAAPPAGAAALTGVMPVVPAAGEVLIGVAIAVPQPWAAELEGWRRRFGDPLGATVPAHVTLVPPTALPRADLPRVREHLARATAATHPFRIALDGTGTFRPVSPVVYVRLAAGSGECSALEERVRAGVLGTRRRFPFHPHVTVAQQLEDDVLDRACAQLSGFDASFDVAQVDLYELGADGRWRSAHTFRLGG